MIETVAIISSLLAILYAFWLKWSIQSADAGSEEMQEIARAIEEGSRAYLKRQYKVVFVVAIIIAGFLAMFLGRMVAGGFLLGAVASALAGYVGMTTAVRANVRTASAARAGVRSAFRLAFKGGAVTGFLVVGLGLLSVAGLWKVSDSIPALVGLGFGGSLISVFARLGGGIFTKGADVGADLVGKLEAGIPEDDARNPAVIADNVGDNVGYDAGMAADLFETYAVTIIAAMLIAASVYGANSYFVYLPLLIGGISIVGSILGSMFVLIGARGSIMGGLYRGLAASAVISAVLLAILFSFSSDMTFHFLGLKNEFLASLVGFAVTAGIVLATEYYTTKKFRQIIENALASTTGHGTNIIMGLAMSMEATVLPVLVILAGMLGAFWLLGIFGVALAATTMLSMAGIIVAF